MQNIDIFSVAVDIYRTSKNFLGTYIDSVDQRTVIQ